jgi:phthalate 4,5-cis-dihydrodiol dehydrogenase
VASTLGLGIVGLGRAAFAMLPSIWSHERVRLIGVADTDRSLRETVAGSLAIRSYEDFAEMCNDESVDAVYVATPHQWHVVHGTTAARAGKHLLVEKPLSLDLEGCQTIRAVASASGVRVIVGHTHAFDPPVQAIGTLVRSGEFGRLRMILAFNYTDFLYRPRRPEELDTDLGGGVIFNQLPHQIDMVREVSSSEITSVLTQVGRWDPARPTEGAAACWLRFRDGSLATTTYSGYAHFDSDEWHNAVGEDGSAKTVGHAAARAALAGLTAADEVSARRRRSFAGTDVREFLHQELARRHFHEHFGEMIVSCDRADLRTVPEGIAVDSDRETRIVELPRDRASRSAVLDELCKAVLDNVDPRHGAEWATQTIAVCLTALRSSREGSELPVIASQPIR